MAIRNIVEIGDEILTKPCRSVEKIDARVLELLDDMIETLHNARGAGLAAPQVGIKKRIAVVDVGEGVWELINPEILDRSDELCSELEGCLSVPGKWGYVDRPRTVTVRALNRDGDVYEVEGSDFFARALCHEIDHLNGELYIDKVTKFADPEDLEENA